MSIRSFNQENRARKDAVAPETESSLGVVLLRVAWLAILLGLAMEVLLFLGAGFGDVFGLESLTADLVKKVSWSALVCSGLAVGASLSKIRLPMMGILGFFAAPLAFEVSRGLYKGTLEALAAGGVRLVVGTLFGGAILSLELRIHPGCLPRRRARVQSLK